MLPKSSLKALDASTVKLNPILANGLAVAHLPMVEEFIDGVFRSIAGSFPDNLKYLGCRRCTPAEEYREVTKTKFSKNIFDIATSYIYLMEYRFSFDNNIISRYMYLPYVGPAGTIYLSGSRFIISPILADKVISVTMTPNKETSVFVRLLKSKLIFYRTAHHYCVDGAVENIFIAWGTLYNKKPTTGQPKATTQAKSTLIHYLLCKHGFSGMFKRYTGIAPVLGGKEITEEHYPTKDWVICESMKLHPKNSKLLYEPSELKIAVRRSDYTRDVKNLIAGFFYIVDHFPTRITPTDAEQTQIWMVLMGHIIWSGHIGENRLYSDIQDHINSLNGYLDMFYARKLEAIGYPCTDIYELFYVVISKFDEWSLTADDKSSTMYDKELSILPFVCSEIISGINKFYFDLNAAKKKELTEKKIVKLMNTNLRQGLIFGLSRSHGEVSTQSTSGDNKALKLTTILVPQSKSSKATSKNKANAKGPRTSSKSRTSIVDPSNHLHASILEIGGAWAIPKAEPNGRARLNTTVLIAEDGSTIRDPKYIDILDNLQQQIKRK